MDWRNVFNRAYYDELNNEHLLVVAIYAMKTELGIETVEDFEKNRHTIFREFSDKLRCYDRLYLFDKSRTPEASTKRRAIRTKIAKWIARIKRRIFKDVEKPAEKTVEQMLCGMDKSDGLNAKKIEACLEICRTIQAASEYRTEIVPKKKKTIPLTLKRRVWNNWIGESVGKAKCACCKLSDVSQMSFHCGHIIAEANGGELKVSNLKPVCQSCNSSMGTMNMDDFIRVYGL